MGSIEEMPIILGQRVRQGDLLLKISAAEIAARALQAQSQLHQARRDLERERDLFSKGASTQDTVHSLEDRQAMTEAMVHEAEAMLGYTSVRAPFDGVVTRKLANAGDLAAPGLPLLELEGLTDFQVEAGIPDSLSGGLKLGQVLRVDLSETNQDLQGTLVELSSAADPAARTVPAKVALPAVPGVRSGQFARIQVPGAPIRVMLVPESSLVRHGQIEAVFIADKDSQAVLRIVKTGALHRERREILSGLSETERIVIDPPAGLREGSKLEVLP
jgi:RND family efflux transporter MFP subunit